jgi:hypothetical protein
MIKKAYLIKINPKIKAILAKGNHLIHLHSTYLKVLVLANITHQ